MLFASEKLNMYVEVLLIEKVYCLT